MKVYLDQVIMSLSSWMKDGNEVNSNFIEVCEFKDLTGGFYTLIVRDEAQCDEKSIVIPILYFPLL